MYTMYSTFTICVHYTTVYVYVMYIYALQYMIIGWLVSRTTHSSSRGPPAQPPPADLRVSSGNVIAALPASFWWPSRAETGTREEGRKTKEDPNNPKEPLTLTS